MLARWFTRGGIGQLVAPDERIANQPQPDESRSALLDFVAPDPNFTSPVEKEVEANAVAPLRLRCQDCGAMISADASSPAAPTTPSTSRNCPVGSAKTDITCRTPSPANAHEDHTLQRQIFSASRETAKMQSLPGDFRKKMDKIFRFCTISNFKDSHGRSIEKIVRKDPTLLHARAVQLGDQAPDSFTPLMAAAHAGSVPAANLILMLADSLDQEDASSVLVETDIYGKTALHIAAERGNIDVVQLLLPRYQLELKKGETEISGKVNVLTSPMPIDVLGRTPLGRALTSPNPKARRNQKELSKALFSPKDASVLGKPVAAEERFSINMDLGLAFGWAHMPGQRIVMEDALCHYGWEVGGKPFMLFGVCDGHGDHGAVSKFVAETTPRVLQKKLAECPDEVDWDKLWNETSLEVDSMLSQKELRGGSTAVFALVAPHCIVVANVGDSRTILVHSGPSVDTLAMEKLTLDAAGDQLPCKKGNIQTDESRKVSSPTVTPLSIDHKPHQPSENDRIHGAGLVVEAVAYKEEGKEEEMIIHRIKKSDGSTLATSRAFGDFDFKANSTLPHEEQAVVCLPDVHVHPRSTDDLYIILACDGVWDCCENEEVMEFVLQKMQNCPDVSERVLPNICDDLLSESLHRGSEDNMTALIVALNKEAERICPSMGGKTLDFSSP